MTTTATRWLGGRSRPGAVAGGVLVVLAGVALPYPAAAADVAHGANLYRRHCTTCHGSGGQPVLPGAPDFSRPTALLRSDLDLLARIRDGRGGMPAYQGQLRDREILDIVAHLRTLR
jgi:cytochrome c6